MMGWAAAGLAGCVLALVSSAVAAAGLMDAYYAARQNDPTLRAARYERDAGQYAIAIGRAGLLPNIGVTGAYSKNKGERTYYTRAGSPTEDLDYREEAAAIALRIEGIEDGVLSRICILKLIHQRRRIGHGVGYHLFRIAHLFYSQKNKTWATKPWQQRGLPRTILRKSYNSCKPVRRWCSRAANRSVMPAM